MKQLKTMEGAFISGDEDELVTLAGRDSQEERVICLFVNNFIVYRIGTQHVSAYASRPLIFIALYIEK